MKIKKALIIVLITIAIITIGIVSVIFYYYSQGSKEHYVPPETEIITVLTDKIVSDLEEISTAIETYYSINLEYPETLDDLVPDILDEIPTVPGKYTPYQYSSDLEENYSVALPNPNEFNVSEIKIENGKLIKK